MWDFRFPRPRVSIWQRSGMIRRVVSQKSTDVSDALISSIQGDPRRLSPCRLVPRLFRRRHKEPINEVPNSPITWPWILRKHFTGRFKRTRWNEHTKINWDFNFQNMKTAVFLAMKCMMQSTLYSCINSWSPTFPYFHKIRGFISVFIKANGWNSLWHAFDPRQVLTSGHSVSILVQS